VETQFLYDDAYRSVSVSCFGANLAVVAFTREEAVGGGGVRRTSASGRNASCFRRD
jgi:hypothetical protein